MYRLVKLLAMVALIAGAVYGSSYVGARTTAAKFLGPRAPNLGARTVQFAFDGVQQLPGHPRAWVVSYGPTSIPGAGTIRFYISPVGKILRVYPPDLEQRLEPYQIQF
jgi:hypothetical protein